MSLRVAHGVFLGFLHRTEDLAGFDLAHRAVGAWPVPDLDKDCIALPFCDNLTIIGRSREDVVAGLTRMMDEFEKMGFLLHEVTDALPAVKVLGDFLDTARGEVLPDPGRAWKVRGALLWLPQGPH